MTTQIQRRRGTTSEHSTFTGAVGEITVDTTKDTVVVHDGSTTGGHPLAKENNPTFTGNVGIGTNAPNQQLEVKGATKGAIRLTDGDTNAFTDIQQDFETTQIINNGTGSIRFSTNGDEKLRITSAGNVGIGTSSPGYPLDVNGVIRSTGTGALLGLSDRSTGIGDRYGMYSNGNTFRLYDFTASLDRVVLTSAGNVGIGTGSPGAPLEISNAGPRIRLRDSDGTDTYGEVSASTGAIFISHRNGAANGQIIFQGQGGGAVAEYGRFDTSGRLLVGLSSNQIIGDTSIAGFQLGGVGNASKMGLANYGTGDSDAPTINFGKSKSGTAGTPGTIVGSNSILGAINFAGDDGTDLQTIGAAIQGRVDGTPGANDMPGRLVFFTTADGASSPTERLRITSAGLVGIGTTPDPGRGPLHVHTTNNVCNIHLTNAASGSGQSDGLTLFSDGAASGGVWLRENGDLRFATNNTEKARIDSSGRLLVGTSEVNSVSGESNIGIYLKSAAYSKIAVVRTANDQNGAELRLAKSRNDGIITGGDNSGRIRFAVHDGVDYNSEVARIEGWNDGSIGADDTPGRLTFSTTASGANSPTERMRITNLGSITIGAAATQGDSFFTVRGTHTTNTINAYTIRQFTDVPASVTGTAFGFHSASNVVNGATLGTYAHYTATQGTITGSTISTQIGFNVSSSLTHATYNYGFYSNIGAGANRWNFHAAGLAQNYFAGNVLFKSTDTAGMVAGTATGKYIQYTDGNLISCRATTTNATHQSFTNTNGIVGTIQTSGSATLYNTSSDYRLKENVTPMVGAADRVKALKPCRFNFISDATNTVDGFLAHEAQEIVPESVTGTKDEMEDIGTLTEWDGTILETNTPEPDSLTWDETITDEDGNETVETRTRTWVKTGDRPVMQGIDQAKLVPLLTGALQEALAKIDDLEARLAAAGL